MANIANRYNPKLNFWKENEEFKDVNPFAKLHSSDKSSGKRISSMKMWALALVYDPDSKFYYMDNKLENVRTAIQSNHRLKFEWEEMEEYMTVFNSMFLNQAEKSLVEWDKRMKERDEFLSVQVWNFDYLDDNGKLVKGTADQLDKMHSQTAKHYKEYLGIAEDLKKLKSKDDVKKKSKSHDLGL